ncbi:acyl-CoA thioesterase domain-containing protein [Gordonia sp. MP11Mi]|uniref:Acyl-CoA thioesterase-like N-terminal HotDog domain-containing protein n=1 Tax=Gordonia sp. MP11Mi TaxID=3022769 RepID=A0AA97CYC3_9ACTN
MAYFERGDEGFLPLSFSQSQWSPESINGSALAGLTAHVLESDCGAPGYQAAKLTLDIFRQPAFAPIQTETMVVREGRSIRMADLFVRQGDRTVARASMVAIRPTQDPAGIRWHPTSEAMAFSEHMAAVLPTPGILWGSDEHPDGWSSTMTEHQNAGRKRLWFDQPRLFADVDNTPLVRAAMVGELTNTLTSWSDHGIGFINHDVTILLARPPVGAIVGIEADNHMSANGIAAGATTMWDTHGRFGISMAGAVAHMIGTLNLSSGPAEWTETNHAYSPDFDATP